MSDENEATTEPAATGRRSFLGTGFMLTGIIASHTAALTFAARYIYPESRKTTQRVFVAFKEAIPQGASFAYRTPRGETINIAHTSAGYVALSDVCPHLKCRVHWDRVVGQFICPCHDGRFAADGSPISGPPKEMNAPLRRFEIVEDGNQLYLEVSA